MWLMGQKTRLILKAKDIRVKVLGIRFGGLTMRNELTCRGVAGQTSITIPNSVCYPNDPKHQRYETNESWQITDTYSYLCGSQLIFDGCLFQVLGLILQFCPQTTEVSGSCQIPGWVGEAMLRTVTLPNPLPTLHKYPCLFFFGGSLKLLVSPRALPRTQIKQLFV